MVTKNSIRKLINRKLNYSTNEAKIVKDDFAKCFFKK